MLGKLLPLVTQLGGYLKAGADHYAFLKSTGVDAGPEVVAVFLREKITFWDPKVNGKSLLDDATRDAAARFLAGVAVNFARTGT
jgi:hypothetical protein